MELNRSTWFCKALTSGFTVDGKALHPAFEDAECHAVWPTQKNVSWLGEVGSQEPYRVLAVLVQVSVFKDSVVAEELDLCAVKCMGRRTCIVEKAPS